MIQSYTKDSRWEYKKNHNEIMGQSKVFKAYGGISRFPSVVLVYINLRICYENMDFMDT